MSGTRREPMHAAEKVTFSVALAILGLLVGAIVLQIPASHEPAAPRATVKAAEERDGRFFVPVSVENVGEKTAENVQVNATLTVDGEEHAADQVVDFLAGGEVEDIEFIFEDDPAEGDLVVQVAGFSVP